MATTLRLHGSKGRHGYVVAIEGLSLDAKEIDAEILAAARDAINKTAERSRTQADRAIRAQVKFPAQYLSPSQGRLTVSKRASARNDDLRATITGRQKATSLARFVVGATKPNAEGVSVEVHPGKAKFMKKAFLIRLPSFGGETQSNLGIAVRLKPGESLRKKAKKVKSEKNLYLLYGPSVDQVFRTVADDISPASAEFLEAEFQRLLKL